MKKNKPKYLKYYYKWMKLGELPHGRGLCCEFGWEDDRAAETILDDYLYPTAKDEKALIKIGYDTLHWGSDAPDKQLGVFTPLRQTLVLLMAALNNEL